MKRFDFSLSSVLDLRKQQAEVERARLQSLLALMNQLDSDLASTRKQFDDARAHVKHAPSTSGDDLIALAHFERFTRNRTSEILTKRNEAGVKISKQQSVVIEAERKVKLLENLEESKRAEWTAEQNKEIEALAADSHLARMLATERNNRAQQ